VSATHADVTLRPKAPAVIAAVDVMLREAFGSHLAAFDRLG
jgi:hypothetical protein